jgi:putative membrane protein
VKGKLAGVLPFLLLVTGIAAAAPAERPARPGPGLGSRYETLSAVKDSTAGVVGRLVAETVRTTPGFVTAAAINDMYEVSAGQIALQRSGSPAVRAFARRMIEDHSASTARLKSTIRDYNVNAALPGRIDARRRGMLDDLRGARPQYFDHRYMVQQVAAHKEADTLMRRYAGIGKINGMRDFAAAAGKTERMHLTMAQTLDPTTRSASDGR